MGAIAPIKVCGNSTVILGATVRSNSATVGYTNTLDPEGFIQPGVARWADRSGGIALGMPRYSLSLRPPSKASRLYRTEARFTYPVLEVTSPSTASGIQPAPTLAYSLMAALSVMVPERASLLERQIFFSQFKSLLFSTLNASDDAPTDASGGNLEAAIVSLDAPY